MTWQIFYSYSHKDEELRDRLSTYLAPLRRKGRIVEWHDRKIEPGTDWDTEISNRLDSANLVLLLLSPEFLASDYCFGVEVEKSLTRLKSGTLRVAPVLLRPCLWEDSPFSELQMIPRDARAISSASSPEEAWKAVALEISKMVSEPAPPTEPAASETLASGLSAALPGIDLVRVQVRAYARLYERTRQRMRQSRERTDRMAAVFRSMRSLAIASYPLLPELANSPSPGERLAAVAVLHVVASQDYLSFLVKTVGSDKPFVGYNAVQALQFAVTALEPSAYPALLEALTAARVALTSAGAGLDSDRWKVLDEAERQLSVTIASFAAPQPAPPDDA
jgi:hypothetical protein